MAHVCLVLICAGAFLVLVLSDPAPPRKMVGKELEVLQEKPIVVRRVLHAHLYPFSLWPLPKFSNQDNEDFDEYHIRRIKRVQIQQNNR
ncbi:unnamed protein product [Leptidea sinapis]|uniref:Uncharacterized protein n=1 Tax=Leptidea sinapis TaxID=189913 RepID=A0A5E4R979_9NEOP|nr:unnamed protein product [Leptidea sinapis]